MAESQLERLDREVKGQPEALRRFARSKFPQASKGSILVGAGDSYAAALAAFYMSQGACLAADPYTLVSNPQIAEGLEVFFISVSGRTSSNVRAAEKVSGLSKRTVALTADPNSKLARLANRTVRLPMTYVPKTSGMLSFSLSLLAVLRIVSGEVSCDFGRALARAKSDSVGFGPGTTYFLGNGAAYPVSLYAAAKTYEILGSKAHAEFIEEFSHLELFSLERTDMVNVFSCFDPLGMSQKLKRALAEHGFESRRVPARGESEAERLFHAVFVVQLSVLGRAKRLGLSEPRFLSAGGRLDVSDAMIY